LVIHKRDKPELEIKVLRRIVDRINLHGSNSNLLGNVVRPSQGVNQKEFSQSLTLCGPIYSKFSKQHHRHVDSRPAFCLVGRQCLIADTMIREGVVATDSTITGKHRNVRPSQITFIVLGGELLEPKVQLPDAGVKLGSIVALVESLNFPIG